MTPGVLLTRPAGSNEGMAVRLRQAGIEIILAPLLQITARPPDPGVRSQIQQLDQIDHIIFVSAHAVNHGMPMLQDFWREWPAALAWYAIGGATAHALQQFDIDPRVPGVASTEGLLALESLHRVRGERVLVVRGVGGREMLAETLRDRGAVVDYLEVYRREIVTLDSTTRVRIERACPLIAPVFSAETARALYENLEGLAREVSIVVPTSRIASVAAGFGFKAIEVAASADEASMLQSTLDLLGRHR